RSLRQGRQYRDRPRPGVGSPGAGKWPAIRAAHSARRPTFRSHHACSHRLTLARVCSHSVLVPRLRKSQDRSDQMIGKWKLDPRPTPEVGPPWPGDEERITWRGISVQPEPDLEVWDTMDNRWEIGLVATGHTLLLVAG